MASDAAAEQNGKSGGKLTDKEKAKLRKQKQKENKQARRQLEEQRKADKPKEAAAALDDDIEIEYVSAPLDLGEAPSADAAPEEDPMEEERAGLGGGGGLGLGFGGLGFTKPKAEDPYEDFKKIFGKFATAEQATGAVPMGLDSDDEVADGEEEEEEEGAGQQKKKEDSSSDSDSDDEDGGGRKKKGMSKKQRKLLTRLKIAELKQLCHRPEVVEVWDVTSPDPQMLVFLKAYRNSVTVPRHWSQKRKYLQGKRGIEKPPFQLPAFIEATGIGEMRQAYQEKEDAKKLKQKQRDRMAPKMGRMDIDYQILHDAFFKHQTRPKLSKIGEVYYEGKEFEASIGDVRPGILSEDLKEALGMTDNTPPPWLINMQRYGPPPSYSNLKIPGLNAPIPAACSFGYQAGGWGKPPVDENGLPLYGDVFGEVGDDMNSDDEVDKETKWGVLEPDVEESSEEESDEEDEEGNEAELADGLASGMTSGMVSGMVSGLTSGMASGMVSGISSSLPSGIETPSMIVNLRKESESEAPKQLYQVLEQKQANVGTGTLMGSDHTYVVPGSATVEGGKKDKKKAGMNMSEVEITLTPEEIEGLDENALKALYEERVKAANKKESFADMVAGHAAQQKRKATKQADDKAAKKAKDFKF